MTGRLSPLVVALALTAAACTGGGSSDPTASPRDDLAGGTLRVGVDASNGWYGCPLFCGGAFDAMSFLSGNTMELMRCCLQRTLLSFPGTTVSEGGSVLQPDLASGMPTISDDELTWTFTIRSGIYYAPPLRDVEVAAADFVRAFTRALTPVSDIPFTDSIGGYVANTYLRDVIEGAAAYADGSATRVSGLEAPDPHTLKIHLTRPVGDFGSRVAWSALGPIPPNPARPLDPLGIAQGHDEDFGNFMVSTGPYMYEGSEALDLNRPPDDQVPPTGDGFDSMTLVRNPSWSPAEDPLRPAYPDRIVVRSVRDGAAAEEMLRSGELDVVLDWNPELDMVHAWRSDPSLANRIYLEPGDAVNYVSINLAMPPFDDLYVRRAMNYAVDQQQVARATSAAGGTVIPTTHIGLDSLEDNLLLTYDYYGSASDRSAAEHEMARSSYDRDGDGRCDAAACRSIPLTVDATRPSEVAAARVVAGNLQVIGLGVHVDPVGFDRVSRIYSDPTVHTALLMTGWIKDIQSASSFFSTLFASATPDRPNLSMIGANTATLRRLGYPPVTIPNVDSLLASCDAQTFEAQTHCWASVDQELTENVVPLIPLTTRQSAWPVGPRVRRFTVDVSAPAPLPALDQIAISGPEPIGSTTPATGHDTGITDGVYRVRVSPTDLRARVPHATTTDAQQTTGALTLIVRDGTFWLRLEGRAQILEPYTVGLLEGSGDRVTFDFRGPNDHLPPLTMRWNQDGDGLMFSDVDCSTFRPPDPFGCGLAQTWFASHGWAMVASIPEG